MKKHAPEAGRYMTHLPVEVERCETVGDAVNVMRNHRFHHIPVMSGSKLKGLVSLTDILSALSEDAERGPQRLLEEICETDVLTVSPVTPIDEVARRWLERRVDCAVVTDGGFVVGILTTTDIVRFVAEQYGQTGR